MIQAKKNLVLLQKKMVRYSETAKGKHDPNNSIKFES